MRFLVVVVSGGAALAFIAASGAMNWVFMTSLGKTWFEQNILGAVSIAVSAFLALLPTLLLWAWRERRILYVILGLPVFLGFAAFSLSSAVGFAAKNRGSLSEDRARATTQLAAVYRDIAEAEAKVKTFGNAKSSSVLRESLHGLEQDRRWQSSKSCAEATADASRAFCKGYLELKAEVASAAEKEALDVRTAALKRQALDLEDQGAGREADNQAAVLARILGSEPARVERGLTLFLAVLVELGAALGLYFATAHLRLERGGRGAKVIDVDVMPGIPVAGRNRIPIAFNKATAPRRVPRLSRGH